MSDAAPYQTMIEFCRPLTNFRRHTSALQAFLWPGTDINLFGPRTVARFVLFVFSQTRLIDLELRDLGPNALFHFSSPDPPRPVHSSIDFC
jgi:hypothetical protein